MSSEPEDKGLPPPQPRPLSHLIPTDPSTAPFLRAAGLGFLAATVPSFVRILLGIILGKKGGRDSILNVLKKLLAVVIKGLSPRGLAVAGGISVGGAQWGESRVEPLVRKVLASLYAQSRRIRANGCAAVEEEGAVGSPRVQEPVPSEETVKRMATFVSGTIASLISITLLQSSPAYARPAFGSAPPDVSASPYPSFVDAPAPTGPAFLKPPAIQSPTLDLTLFVLVRATDTVVRTIYEYTGPSSGRSGAVVNQLARLDPRLLKLLQYAKSGEYVYRQVPSPKVAIMSAGIAGALGENFKLVNPQYIDRLPCKFVHGKLGGPGRCEVNAIRRWARAFLDSMFIYLPVHLIPHLLFGLRGLAGRPLPVLLKILIAACRSSAFLATFTASIYASVCFVRTGIPSVFPAVSQQILDSGLCTALGCFLCGFSVLIENKHRRREMALFVAPRALYAMMDEFVPAFLTKGAAGDILSRWIERLVFAASTGTILSATVHRPDLVSGVVRGVFGTAVGDWGKKARALEK
ncbi:hypothetical protein RQP46_005949 [Phenoliferia psychrophenolica]